MESIFINKYNFLNILRNSNFDTIYTIIDVTKYVDKVIDISFILFLNLFKYFSFLIPFKLKLIIMLYPTENTIPITLNNVSKILISIIFSFLKTNENKQNNIDDNMDINSNVIKSLNNIFFIL